MREDVHEVEGGVELQAAAAPFQHVRSIGEDVSAAELLLPAGHRLRPVDVAAAGAAGATELAVRRRPVVTVIPTGDEIRPVGYRARRRRAARHERRDARRPGRGGGLRGAPVRDHAGRAGADRGGGEGGGREIRPRDRDRRLERGPRRPHGGGGRVAWERSPSTAWPSAQATRWCSEWSTATPTPVLGAPGYPVSAALTFDIFAAPLLARLEGAPPPEAPVARARLARKLASTMGMDDWVRVRLGRVGGQLVATPLPRGAGVLTSLVRADGLLVVPAALEGHHAGEDVTVRLLRGVGEIERTIVATGSHDLVLDLAASALRERDPRVTLASSNVGSLGGLTALRDGLCHVAGSHLLDPATGEYTLPYLEKLLPGRDVAVVRLVHRDQGLIVAPGNPTGNDRHRGCRFAGVAVRQSSARRGHADAARPRARAARDRARRDRRLRARGAHPPRRGRGRGGRAGGLRARRAGRRAGVRAGLRSGGAGAV